MEELGSCRPRLRVGTVGVEGCVDGVLEGAAFDEFWAVGSRA